jgi:membrane associated rhomboid family serine protease
VLGYGAIELLLALADRQGDNVAHYAHLGGMLIGYIILKYWQKQGRLYS